MKKAKSKNTNPIGVKRGKYTTQKVRANIIPGAEAGTVVAIFRGKFKNRPMTPKQMIHALGQSLAS